MGNTDLRIPQYGEEIWLTNSWKIEEKLKAGKNEEWHGRSYVTYTDGYKTYTEYSEIVDYPVSKGGKKWKSTMKSQK